MLELLVGELPSGHVHTSPYLPLGQVSTCTSVTGEDGLSTKVNLKCVIHDNDTADVMGSQLHSDGSVSAGDSVFVSRNRQCGGFQGSEGIGGLLSRPALPHNSLTNLPEKTQTENSQLPLLMDSRTSLVEVGRTSLVEGSQTSLPNDSQTSLLEGSQTSPCHGTMANSHDVLFRRGLLKPVMSILRNKLTKESWKKQPTAKHALVWCLRQLKVCLCS